MRFVLVASLAGLTTPLSAAAATLVVPDAFGTIGAALGVASSGDTVLVRSGTYPEHVVMVDGVVLRGDDPVDRPVLDGTLSGTALTASSCGDSTRVEDLVIANGSSAGLGGGVCLMDADVVFSNCDFLDSMANLGGGLGAVGSWFTVDGCRFSGNSAGQSGGAIAMTDASSPTVQATTFTGNVAFAGGAIAVRNGSTPTITGCLFDGDSADEGAAIWYGFFTGGPLQQCTIVSGQASGANGGILYLASVAAPLIQNNVIAFGLQGGAVAAAGGASAQFGCNCLFGNVGGDNLVGGTDLGTNFVADPLFCDPGGGDFRVFDASPCALDSTCAPVGAYGVGCTALSAPESVSFSSWGKLKSYWR